MAPLNTISRHHKTAIVLFNLGGPDSLAAVQPFLFNLFNDPAIIGLPQPLRRLLATFISRKRAPVAQKIYEEIGGKSPLIENTENQANALEASLTGHGNVKVFYTMRYWHPMADAVVQQVKNFAPDHIILLPLYPHYSTTTTGSSFKDWDRAATRAGMKIPTRRICCYPTHREFIAAHVALIRTYYEEAKQFGAPRILFSAHGLPEKIIRRGDPYQAQIEATTQAIVEALAIPGLDYANCYQSRVGPMQWIGPATPDELLRAGFEKKPVVLVPIAFVSEHSETLVELDIEYAELAHSNGVNHYYRVPTLSTQAHFIAALSDLCLNLTAGPAPVSDTGGRFCGPEWKQCPCKVAVPA
ncbi:MAG: ferrochelatase [Alphaproteobacteria bacterium]|nr:ferrochelatase [Alphaproteobacteria bacterium]